MHRRFLRVCGAPVRAATQARSGMAASLGHLAAVFSMVASPLDDALLGVFGVSALVMSVGAVPLVTQLFPRSERVRDVDEAAARESRG